MFWIVQENLLKHEDYMDLVNTLDRCGVPYASVEVLPMTAGLPLADRIRGLPNDIPQRTYVCGSNTLAMIAREYDWVPGSFMNENFDSRIWIPAYGEHALNPDAQTYRFADVPEQHEPFFVRPVLDTKSFTGEVYETWEKFAAWQHKIIVLKEGYTTLDADTMVSVAAWAKIIDEYRHFFIDGELITSSRYKRRGRMSIDALVDDDVKDFAHFMAHRWSPDRAFVLDTARVENADGEIEHKVIEVNNINSCGYYACDISKIVQVIDAMEF